jgi:zinc D-Ala-D-Ala carboxypeptidase
MKLSKHVSIKEGVYSITAKRLGLDNYPTSDHIINMELICEKIFEPLRKAVGGPIKINSFYRGEKLNKAIGGSKSSQHCSGQAMDIDDTYSYMTNAEMHSYIRKNLSFDQLIWEFGTDDNPNWVHVSYVSEEANRKRCLKAYRSPGSRLTRYMIM